MAIFSNGIVDGLVEMGSKVIDRVIPDPQAKAAAQLELMKLAQNGELESMKTQMSAIIAEASSTDPWTSRARPSFMYVIYILLLVSIPMGVLSAFNPGAAVEISHGMTNYLEQIPDSLYTLFGAGYLGYAGMRGIEKIKGAKGG